MEEKIQVTVSNKPGRFWWNKYTIISVNQEISMTPEKIKQLVIDISKEFGEYEKYTSINVYRVLDFYKNEVSSYFISLDNPRITTTERDFLESLFPRFCENYGIYQTGFVITLDIFNGSYTRTIQKLKDEILCPNS